MPPATRHAAAQSLPTPGQVIAGKYTIEKVLGEGGMGIVFEATHLRLRQRVAVKMLLPEMLEHPVIVTRFEREARAAGQLRNRHAARVVDVDVTPEGLPYMVMELLEGHDLQTELDRRGRLRVGEAVDYVLQACSAMIEAHQLGIVHRDLKPANLFLAFESDARDARIVKVLDFGISKLQGEGDAKLTTAESVMGTAMYMSPEQVRSSGMVDARSDIWSLGIILYELLSGRPPWVGTATQLAAAIVTEDVPDVRGVAPDVPHEIVAVVGKALRRDPQERFADVKQLALALAPFAPPGGTGRLLADALMNGASGQLPRVSIRPAVELEDARTLVQAAAVSESKMRGEGTAPGWSQHRAPGTRGRTLVVGFLVAFGVGLVLLGGIAFAWMRSSAAARHRASASASTTAIASVDPAVPAPGAAPAAGPLPPVVEPAAPAAPLAGAAASASAEVAATPRPRPPPPGKPAATAATAGKPPATAATAGKPPPKPAPAATVNPLTL